MLQVGVAYMVIFRDAIRDAGYIRRSMLCLIMHDVTITRLAGGTRLAAQFCIVNIDACRKHARNVFTARCYASAVLAIGLCLSVSVSVCLSDTSRSSTKTDKRRITQTTPHDIPGTLAFGCQRSPLNSIGVTPCGGVKCMLGGSKSATFDK